MSDFSSIPGLRPPAGLHLRKKPGLGIDRQHGAAQDAGVGLVEHRRAGQGCRLSASGPGNSGQIEKVIGEEYEKKYPISSPAVNRGYGLMYGWKR